MAGLDQGLQPLPRYMCIDLGRRDVRVPEKLLNGAQIRAAVDQVAGEGVAQDVRGEGAGVESRLWRQRFQELRDARRRDVARRAARREHEGRAASLRDE